MTDPTTQLWHDASAELLGWFQRRVDPTTAEDLRQEVFLRIQTRIGDLRDPAALPAWTWRIARNVWIDHLRRAREVDPLPPELAAPEPVQERSDTLARWVAAQLDTLPPAQAAALRATDLGGQTQAEAAADAGVSVSGMKSRVQRGRARVRAALLACCAVELDVRGAVIGHTPRDCGCQTC